MLGDTEGARDKFPTELCERHAPVVLWGVSSAGESHALVSAFRISPKKVWLSVSSPASFGLLYFSWAFVLGFEAPVSEGSWKLFADKLWAEIRLCGSKGTGCAGSFVLLGCGVSFVISIALSSLTVANNLFHLTLVHSIKYKMLRYVQRTCLCMHGGKFQIVFCELSHDKFGFLCNLHVNDVSLPGTT